MPEKLQVTALRPGLPRVENLGWGAVDDIWGISFTASIKARMYVEYHVK